MRTQTFYAVQRKRDRLTGTTLVCWRHDSGDWLGDNKMALQKRQAIPNPNWGVAGKVAGGTGR